MALVFIRPTVYSSLSKNKAEFEKEKRKETGEKNLKISWSEYFVSLIMEITILRKDVALKDREYQHSLTAFELYRKEND